MLLWSWDSWYRAVGLRVCVLKCRESSGVLWGVLGCSARGAGNGRCVYRGGLCIDIEIGRQINTEGVCNCVCNIGIAINLQII